MKKVKTFVRVCFALFVLLLVGLVVSSYLNKGPIPLDSKLQAIADRIKKQDQQAQDPAINGLLLIKDDLYLLKDAPAEQHKKLEQKWAPRIKIAPHQTFGGKLDDYRVWEKEKPAELTQAMKDFGQSNLPILREMAAKPRFIFDSSGYDPRSRVPNFIFIRSLAQSVAMYAFYQSEHGQVGEAVNLLASQLRMHADMGQDGNLITQMISAACQTILLERLQPMLMDPRLTEADLAECAQSLAAVPSDWAAAKNAAEAEELMFHHSVSLMKSGEPFLDGVDVEGAEPFFGLVRATPLLMADYRFGRGVYANWQKGVEDPKVFDFTVEGLDTFEKYPVKLYFMTQMFMPNYPRSVPRFRELLTRIGAARLTCALQRFHLKAKKYPDKLEELVPQYLSELPKSYTNAQFAFTYAPEGKSFKLSSPVEDNSYLKSTLSPTWGPEDLTSLQLVPLYQAP